jgi:hypothetical protein
MASVASKVGAAAKGIARTKAATADTSGKQETTSPLYYEQNPSNRVRLLNDIDRIRVQFDSYRIVTKWYFLLLWLIGAIITGSLISQWGYSNLRNRASLFGLWNEIIQSVREFILKSGKPEEDEVVIAALKAASVMFAKPRGWRGLRRTLEKLHRDSPKWPGYYELVVRLQRARDSCSEEPSWSMLHLPLLGQNMVASPALSYYDYLTKEYWRFAEFAINCPAAVCVFCLTMGLYFCVLSFMYFSHAWIVGSVLVGLALVVYLVAYFWWNPNVAFTSYQLYVQARSGLITGLSLFPAVNAAVTNPMIQKMYTDCPDFRMWYCKSYRGKLGLPPKEKCDAASCTVTTAASTAVTTAAKTEAEAQPGPAAPCPPQAQVNVQVGAPFQVSVSIQSEGDAHKKPS